MRLKAFLWTLLKTIYKHKKKPHHNSEFILFSVFIKQRHNQLNWLTFVSDLLHLCNELWLQHDIGFFTEGYLDNPEK